MKICFRNLLIYFRISEFYEFQWKLFPRITHYFKASNIVKFHVNKYNLLTPQDLYSISSCPHQYDYLASHEKVSTDHLSATKYRALQCNEQALQWGHLQSKNKTCIVFCSSLEILQIYLLKCSKNSIERIRIEEKVFCPSQQ